MIKKPKPTSIVKGKIDTHNLNKVVKNNNERKQELFECVCLLDDKN